MLTLALSLIGLSVAAWQDGLSATATTATGDINPVFTDCDIKYEYGTGDAYASFNGKTLSIEIEEAKPGYTVTFEYEVENQGSVPVVFDVVLDYSTLGIEVTNTPPPKSVLEKDGDSVVGYVTVTVGENVEPGSYYDGIGLVLSFKQWNLTD